MPRPAPDNVAAIVAALATTKKYGRVCEPVLARTAAWALERYPNEKAALKAAKRKLHQIFGAFIRPEALAELDRRLGRAPWGDAQAMRAWAKDVLALHASTAERLPYIDTLYDEIFAITGPPRNIVDLGAGLHPFSHGWMRLSDECHYTAIDMDVQLQAAWRRFFAGSDINADAEAADVLTWCPQSDVDVVFLFKLLPTLEREASGAAAALLERVKARWSVVSFPTRSLGGFARGMEAQYKRLILELSRHRGWEVYVLEFGSEHFYIMRTGGTENVNH